MRRDLKTKTAVGCTLAMILLGSLNVPADAATAEQRYVITTRRVKFADLNINHSEGAAALYRRILQAAKAVCEPTSNWLLLTGDAYRCEAQAIDRAVADVNAPMLTSYHVAKTAQPLRLAEKQ
jgi:UrcA family protein